MHRLSFLILFLGALASLAVAATAPTFCKCTCFTNSTIIEIKPKSSPGGAPKPPSQLKPPSGGDTKTKTNPTAPADDDQDALSFPSELEEIIAAAEEDTIGIRKRSQPRRAQGGSSAGPCGQCNRNFCLSQSLPICKGAADKDVSTMCFQRDSRKDQVIVWGFILGTAGLLGWAGLQKVVDMRQSRSLGGGLGGLPGIRGGIGRANGGGGLPRGRREGGGGGGSAAGGILSLGRGGLGSTGTDGGRGAYAAVAGHSRDDSLRTN
ncbi:hypothetical protein DHEL01_v205251 [Diaporthe helianthi]|uniref:Integral membrane protein n=1 Tax=Diaporthe helianthi TaxID=158607 RepID=A0A2P5I1E7_DIAHE|nr:hypothetical protein DHEL01_v205251 [Diaporthe helianthi]